MSPDAWCISLGKYNNSFAFFPVLDLFYTLKHVSLFLDLPSCFGCAYSLETLLEKWCVYMCVCEEGVKFFTEKSLLSYLVEKLFNITKN